MDADMTSKKPSRLSLWLPACLLALPVYYIVIVRGQTQPEHKTVTPLGWVLGYLVFVLFSAAFLYAVRSFFNKTPAISEKPELPHSSSGTVHHPQVTPSVFDYFIEVLAEGKRSSSGYIPQTGPLADAAAVRNAILREFRREQNPPPELIEHFASAYGDTAWIALPEEIERYESLASRAKLDRAEDFLDHSKSGDLLRSVEEIQRVNSRTLELRTEFRAKALEYA